MQERNDDKRNEKVTDSIRTSSPVHRFVFFCSQVNFLSHCSVVTRMKEHVRLLLLIFMLMKFLEIKVGLMFTRQFNFLLVICRPAQFSNAFFIEGESNDLAT